MQNRRAALISLYHYGAFGTRVLRDVLRQKGFEVYSIYFKRDKTNAMTLPSGAELDMLAGLLKNIKPALAGVSVRSTFYPVAKTITPLLKASGAYTVWGGAHPTICPEECIPYADAVCVGEGEKPLSELAERAADGREITGINGLWINRNGAVEKNQAECLLQDLDSLPLPSYDGKNDFSIEDGKLAEGDPCYNDGLTHYNFMTARGCPFHCDFCSNSILKDIFRDKGAFIRQRSVANVIAELKYVKRRFPNLQVVSSNDEVFSLNKEWLREFCTEYGKEIGLPFHCDIHPSLVNDEIMAMMSAAGLKTVSIGVQSGSERVRKELYGRNTPDEKLLEAGRIFSKYGVFPSYDLIFDNPMETAEDTRKTLDMMLALPRPYRINMYSMQYHPKTKLTEKFLKAGLIKEEDIDGKSLKGFQQWHVRYDWRKQDPELVYLYKLFLLLSTFVNKSKRNSNDVFALFPKLFVRFLAGSRFFRRHQRLTDWVPLLPKISYGLGLLIQGEFGKIAKKLA